MELSIPKDIGGGRIGGGSEIPGVLWADCGRGLLGGVLAFPKGILG